MSAETNVGHAMRKTILKLLVLVTAGFFSPAAQAQLAGSGTSLGPSDPTYPFYRIRYLADIVERDRGSETLIEEGVFNTDAQAREVINVLAHLVIAWRVDCACEEIRRDVFGAADLEERLMLMLNDSGYVSRLVPAAEVPALPDYVGVLTPYLILAGDGSISSNTGWFDQDRSNIWGWGPGGTSSRTSTTLDPDNPRQYARVNYNGIFVDSRLESYVQARIGQLMSGYRLDDPVSLCAFAALERSPDDMMSWVLIEDLRRTWSGGGSQ